MLEVQSAPLMVGTSRMRKTRFKDHVLSDLKVRSFSFNEMHIGNLGMDTRGEVQADFNYPDQGLWDGRREGGL